MVAISYHLSYNSFYLQVSLIILIQYSSKTTSTQQHLTVASSYGRNTFSYSLNHLKLYEGLFWLYVGTPWLSLDLLNDNMTLMLTMPRCWSIPFTNTLESHLLAPATAPYGHYHYNNS